MSDNAGPTTAHEAEAAEPAGTENAAIAPAPGEDTPEAEPETAPRKKRLSGRARLFLVIATVVAIAAGLAWYVRHDTYGQYMQATDDAQIQADLVTIAPKISGYVDAVLVEENEDVRAGQPLIRIDAADYESQTAQARAQIAQAEAGADNARAGIDVQHAQIAQARAELAAARTEAAHDAREVARYRPLVAMGAETRERLSELEAQARQSADRVRQQAAALAAQTRRIAGMRAQVRQSEAQKEQAQAQLDAAQTDLSGTALSSPVAGRVGDKTVTVGQFVQPGTKLMSVVPLQSLYITANFKETQLALMRPGQPVTIAVDALPGVEIAGHVESLSPATGAQFSLLPPENATGNFTKIVQRVPVRIAIDAAPAARALMVPGMSVNVTVDTRAAKGDLDRIQQQQDALDRQRPPRAPARKQAQPRGGAAR